MRRWTIPRSYTTKVSHKTENPKLWNVYWGNFVYGDKNPGITDQIIANRDVFAKTYSIARSVQYKNTGCLYENWLFDHIELYRTRTSQVIMVVSPYCSETNKVKLQNLGFSICDPIYHTAATSFVQRFDGRRDFLQFVKKFEPERPKMISSRPKKTVVSCSESWEKDKEKNDRNGMNE